MGRPRKKIDFLAVVKELLKKQPVKFEDGCAIVEVEFKGYYLYCYDWFDGNTFEYSLCDPKNDYKAIELPQEVLSFLKTELKRVYDDNIADFLTESEENTLTAFDYED